MEENKKTVHYLVSIIVPAWNAENYLRRCIISVQQQTYQNWELLIVDDGSTDNSVSICEEFVEVDSRIHLFRKQHGGTANARNYAIDVANGDYIAFLDADDAFHPSFLSSMIQSIAENGCEIALCATIRGTEAEVFFSDEKSPQFHIISVDEALYEMYNGNWPDLIAPYTKIYDRRIFDKVRFPAGMFFEDAATMNKAIYYANAIAKTNEPLYFYNITPNSSSVTKRSIELLDREKALRSHWEFYKQQKRLDLEKMAMPFYLIQLISIYHRVEMSDKPEDRKLIRAQFNRIYKEYKGRIRFTETQKDQILAFRMPKVYDIRNMIRKEGLICTIKGFIKRKIKRLIAKRV